jgi:hypothetical protein
MDGTKLKITSTVQRILFINLKINRITYTFTLSEIFAATPWLTSTIYVYQVCTVVLAS